MKYLILIITAFLVSSCALAPAPKLFSVNLTSPNHEAGETDAYFAGFLSIGKLKKNPIKVYYYPVEDAVCLQFRDQFIYCNQFWDKTGRDAFISAFDFYKTEFDQRKLTQKGRKAGNAYGTVQGYFMWKKTRVSVQARGYPKVSLGYKFKDNAVFFTTTQTEATYVDPESRDMNQTIPEMTIYFTREQAANLAEMFNHEYLKRLENPAAGTGGVDEYY